MSQCCLHPRKQSFGKCQHEDRARREGERMLRNERPPRWPYELEPVSGLTGGLVASGARLPIKRQWRMSTFTRVTVAGAALGFHQLPVCT